MPESDNARAVKDYSTRLSLTDRVFNTVYHEIIAWLKPLQSSHVLDAGCGSGGMTKAFATAVGQTGHVTALDITPHHLLATKDGLQASGLLEHVTLIQSSVDHIPFKNDTFDVIWCSHVVHGQGDPRHTVGELTRVLRPGGYLALREDVAPIRSLPLMHAPLEAALWAQLMIEYLRWRNDLPDAKMLDLDWLELLQHAGLQTFRVKTFAKDFVQILTADEVAFLQYYLSDMQAVAHHLSQAQQDALYPLLDVSSPHYVLRHPGFHAIYPVTVYVGRKAGSK
jgi:ubiquinone/menaquinone biosynthesis C-methylase UbiE